MSVCVISIYVLFIIWNCVIGCYVWSRLVLHFYAWTNVLLSAHECVCVCLFTCVLCVFVSVIVYCVRVTESGRNVSVFLSTVYVRACVCVSVRLFSALVVCMCSYVWVCSCKYVRVYLCWFWLMFGRGVDGDAAIIDISPKGVDVWRSVSLSGRVGEGGCKWQRMKRGKQRSERKEGAKGKRHWKRREKRKEK